MAAFKPVVTGLDEPVEDWPRDHELLAAAAGAGSARGGRAVPLRAAAVAALAAELAGVKIEPARLVDAAPRAAPSGRVLVAEGVGGLLVPLTPGYLVRDLARRARRCRS